MEGEEKENNMIQWSEKKKKNRTRLRKLKYRGGGEDNVQGLSRN